MVYQVNKGHHGVMKELATHVAPAIQRLSDEGSIPSASISWVSKMMQSGLGHPQNHKVYL